MTQTLTDDRQAEMQAAIVALMGHTGVVIAHALDADFLGIAEVMEDAGTVMLKVWQTESGIDVPPVCQESLDIESMGELYTSENPQIAVKASSKKKSQPGMDGEFLDKLGLRSMLTAPFYFQGWPLGAVCVYRTGQKHFTTDDISTTKQIAQPLRSLVGVAAEATDLAAMSRAVLESAGNLDAATPETSEPTPEKKRIGKELRTSLRQEFSVTQSIAPVVYGALPHREHFVEVECCDLSAGGFSFYLDKPPPYDTLVLRLGPPGSDTFVSARVAHVREVEHDGETAQLIGCQFIGKVYL